MAKFKRRKYPLLPEYLSLYDAVAFLAEKEFGPKWFDKSIDRYLPCYQKTIGNYKIWARDEIEIAKNGKPQFVYAEVRVSIVKRAMLSEAKNQLLKQLRFLIEQVQAGKIVGRLEPTRHAALTLDQTNAHTLRGQKIAAFCTNYILLELDGKLERCLVSFKIGALERLKPKSRKTANQYARGISREERIRLNKIVALAFKLHGKLDTHKLPAFPKAELAAELAKLAMIPRRASDNSHEGSRYVADITIKNAIVSRKELSAIVSSGGRPQKENEDKKIKFLEQLGRMKDSLATPSKTPRAPKP